MAGLMYGLCMRLDSVLSRMEMVESIAVEVHSLLEFADCTVSKWLMFSGGFLGTG